MFLAGIAGERTTGAGDSIAVEAVIVERNKVRAKKPKTIVHTMREIIIVRYTR
jgi:hypothetical protein